MLGQPAVAAAPIAAPKLITASVNALTKSIVQAVFVLIPLVSYEQTQNPHPQSHLEEVRGCQCAADPGREHQHPEPVEILDHGALGVFATIASAIA